MKEHDIKIFRDGNAVYIRVPTDVSSGSGEYHLDFKYEREHEFDAELLARYLQKRHTEKIKSIRKIEFFSGWKHAKAKKHGKKFFNWFKGGMQASATNP